RTVSRRLRALGLELDHLGPHALRHACATRLLQKGSSLKEIADFLGHRDTKSVGIYAKCDISALRKVAAFGLAGLQ
ncbi:MAG: tyrosine-type recombinase/integrase, partial [Acidobacteriales bacterium]|nr:tyrosine-type recombinase/integrase [Terriglobales bacterium]